MVLGAMQQRVIEWWPVNERMCRLRICDRFFNLSIINVHSPHLLYAPGEGLRPLSKTWCEDRWCEATLMHRSDRIRSTQIHAVLACLWCEKKLILVGAYRHPGEISGEISAYGTNIKQLTAVLVCQIFATINNAWWNFVESVSAYWTTITCCGKIQFKNCIIHHKTWMNINWETANCCASIKYLIWNKYFTFQ